MRARIANHVVTLLAFALIIGIVAACTATGSTAGEGKPGKTSASYALRQSDSVTLAPGTTLKLDRVNDSRCKRGAVCVWAGFISYTFTLTGPQGARTFVLAENMPNAAPVAMLDGLKFALEKLDPPEPPALDAPVPDYRVSLRVSIVQPARP
jgi:hypothetical protein